MNLATRITRARAGIPLALALVVSFALVALTTDRPATASSTDRPGDLGLLVGELPYVLPKGFDPDRGGAYVIEVFSGGPADRGGVLEGDIVLEFDNQEVTSAAQLGGMVRRLGAGRLASMRVWRNGRIHYTGLMQLDERRNAGHGPGPGAGPSPARIDALQARIDRLERDVSDLTTRLERLESAGRAQH